MKRKTNLFYKSSSQDSSFLTFSNYTEALTGNLMSTDNKIFPSSFLCIQLSKLKSYEYAMSTYTKFINSILESKNVKYVLKNEVLLYQVTGDMNDLTSRYSYDDVEFKSGAILTRECIDNLPSSVEFTIRYLKKDGTLIREEKVNQGSQAKATIDKTYLDYEEDPKFVTDKTDEISIYKWNKQQLLNKLVSKYENKMATLRDWCVENDKQQDKTLLPLNYLLESIREFDPSMSINYVGDVTEQDWNGTFADTICVVDTNKFKSGKLKIDDSQEISLVSLEKESDEYLHGWWTTYSKYNPDLDFDKDGKNTVSVNKDSSNGLYTNLLSDKNEEWMMKFKKTHQISTTDTDDYNTFLMMVPQSDQDKEDYLKKLDDIVEASRIYERWIGPRYVEDLTPEYDNYDSGINYYNLSSSISSIDYDIHDNVKEWKTLEFNIVIPLFDLVDTNYVTNSTSVQSSDSMDLTLGTDSIIKNIPLGLWFSGPQDVTLKADLVTGFSPTWSLSLSSQFKPFPNSTYMPSEITQDAKKEAYMTFAQILSRQNEILDKVSDLYKSFSSLSNRMSTIESSMGAVLNSYNLDNFRKEYADFKNDVTYQVTYLASTIDALDLRWVNRES